MAGCGGVRFALEFDTRKVDPKPGQRTRLDWERCVQHPVDVRYPEAEGILLVMDQVDTHSTVLHYVAFPAAETKRLADRSEFHRTPEYCGWLYAAELELAVQKRQRVRRISDRPALEPALAAWAGRRSAAGTAVDRHFMSAGTNHRGRGPGGADGSSAEPGMASQPRANG